MMVMMVIMMMMMMTMMIMMKMMMMMIIFIIVTLGQSANWIQHENKLGSGLIQFRYSSLSNCFKQAIHVPPFDVDGFETRDGKLVYNVLKKFSSHIKIHLT